MSAVDVALAAQVKVPMENAYDIKVLGKRFEAAGMAGLEQKTLEALDIMLGWIDDSARISKNLADDMVRPVLPYVRKSVVPFVDKISPDIESK